MASIEDRFAALLPPDVPDEASVGYIAELFNITSGAVNAAIRKKRIPARTLRSGGGKGIHIVNVADAAVVWGHRLLRAREDDAARASGAEPTAADAD